MSSRALSFGAMAEAYERFRPGYPAELADMVLTYAGQPVRTALEIGAGTGKATRLFAQRGITVTATEPDAAMLAELLKHGPGNVKTVHSAFEDLPSDESYGLVYSAAALHWTNPDGRWPRMAALLEPDGVFASFGGPAQLADPAVAEAVRAVRAPFLDSDDVPSPDGTPPEQDMQWPGTELQKSEWFADVQQLVIKRRLTMSARDYIGHLSTVSAYLELPASEQEQVFSQIMQVLPDTVEIAADITVHLARRSMAERTGEQLHVIRKVIAVTQAAGISAWLFGGWGLDARIGRITREHGDVEFWVERTNAERSKAALVAAGATALATQPPAEACEFRWDDVLFSTAYFDRQPDGSSGQLPGRWSDWLFPPGSFGDEPGTLDGMPVLAMSVSGMLAMKEQFPHLRNGRPWRQKDIADIEVLRGLAAGEQADATPERPERAQAG